MRWLALCTAALSWACQTPPAEVGPPTFPTEREPCADRDQVKRALFGDLHVHTGFSFDARSYDTVLSPADAYRFARGEPVSIPPLANGVGTRQVQLDRPLDFAAVTDHGEFLGEVAQCTTPGSPGYDSETCVDYRDPEVNGAVRLAIKLSVPGSPRFEDICGPFDRDCISAATSRWISMQRAAEDAYDRTSSCAFTSFPAYEYTNTAAVSNLHRNVVFASSVVPERPVSVFEAPSPHDLWTELRRQCRDAGTGCDVVVLPHNSNLSNGNLFYLGDERNLTGVEQRERAILRAAMEPVVEIFQHKGDSECRNGLGDDTDPLCGFEKLRPADAEVCGEVPGSGGMRLQGCVHRLDFVRNALTEGLAYQGEVDVNPFRLGFIGSTDTHNGTPGNVATQSFPGHIGVVDDTAAERLGRGNVTHDGIINNPGGLAAVWATENSRPAIFEALRQRETFATSGPRIELRLFASEDFDDAICASTSTAREIATAGYAGGVPMGGVLEEPASAPEILIHARADKTPLERIQVIKGWVDADGVQRQQVYDVATSDAGAEVDSRTCVATGGGWMERCALWRDPDFDPGQRAFYYTRVLENPTCRWSALTCNALPEAERPESCDDPDIEGVVQQRAWSSPIWIEPG